MKRIIFMGLAVIAIVGCTTSPEKKVENLVGQAVKGALYHPESYDPIGTVIDSAFAPKDDPAFFEKAHQLYDISMEIETNEGLLRSAKSSMAIWSGSYSAFSKAQYEEAKEEYEKYATKKESLQKKGEKLAEEMREIAERGRTFIGWKATHSYRAQNNAGQTLIGKSIFIIDPDMTQVLAGYNTDDSDYKKVQMMYEMMEEAE